jgi:hypothetical protein
MGSAAALAKFYSMLANGGKFNGQAFFSQEALAQIRRHYRTAWIVFFKSQRRSRPGS